MRRIPKSGPPSREGGGCREGVRCRRRPQSWEGVTWPRSVGKPAEGVRFTQGSAGLVGVIRKRNRMPCKGGDEFEPFKKFHDSSWYSRA